MRQLSSEEINLLKNQGCSASNWSNMLIKEPFNAKCIQDVKFSGNVSLGCFSKTVVLPSGIEKPAGLYNTLVHNCSIGDNVYISNVANLANYDIEDEVTIENVNALLVNSENSFGNGVKIDILNEGGGRNIKIFDQLSAQIAYLWVIYRHNKNLINQLSKIVDLYISKKLSDRGKIEKGSKINNCSKIINVNIGKYASISGASELENGTIISYKENPTYIGQNVTAKDFIIHTDSKVDNGAILDRCFIGQGVKIGKQYSAENSAFFANCECFHGEASSIFAGPYTVTHHKSTLLIAGLFSFYNAGSGTNQSNHMYKLGPIHQGILERGSKTGSSSYLLWPSHAGAFTVVIGKHYTNFDSSNIPFSYINEEGDKSVLTPAMNLITVGTRRDSEKWKKRDRRENPDKLDIISFDLLNPYTVGKMLNGQKVLQDLYSSANENQEFVSYNGLNIKRLLLKTGIKYYEMGIKAYIGKKLSSKLKNLSSNPTLNDIKKLFKPAIHEGKSEWVDLCGMIAPLDSVSKLIEKISTEKIQGVEGLLQEIKSINAKYEELEWSWCSDLIKKKYDIEIDTLSKDDLLKIVDDWKVNTVKLNNMIEKDATREFSNTAKIGFGIDGDENVKEQDFEAVRGTYENNSFVKELISESEKVQEEAERVTSIVKNLN